jgi:hypothetical protein
VRDLETIDAELRLLAAVRLSIREHGGEPSSRQVGRIARRAFQEMAKTVRPKDRHRSSDRNNSKGSGSAGWIKPRRRVGRSSSLPRRGRRAPYGRAHDRIPDGSPLSRSGLRTTTAHQPVGASQLAIVCIFLSDNASSPCLTALTGNCATPWVSQLHNFCRSSPSFSISPSIETDIPT